MAKTKIRSAYSGHVHVFNPIWSETTRVKREFKTEVDINSIWEKAKRGINPPLWMTSKTPMYGDFTNVPVSLDEAHNIIIRAKEAFAALPVGFRSALDNDFTRLASAPRELFEEYGLIKAAASPASRDDRVSLDSPEGTSDKVAPNAPTGAKKGGQVKPAAPSGSAD